MPAERCVLQSGVYGSARCGHHSLDVVDPPFLIEPVGGEIREILDGTMAQYAESGHIVYTTADGTLMAAPFDLTSLTVGRQLPWPQAVA